MHKTLYYRFLKLLVLALLASSLFFFLLNRGGSVLLQSYFTKTDYMERENQKRVETFKSFVKKRNLSSADTDKLSRWVERQSVVWMQIYRDHILLYDSQFPYMASNPKYHVEGRFYEWDSYETVDFKDGPAQVFLTGMYTYQFYNCALLVEFFLSFLLFIGIIMAGIRKTMKYIRKLSGEIGILEGGNLDYRITVRGDDELAVLARGLDNMRESIRNQIGQEADLIRLNKAMITSLSHDLRTPLTALLIYTEIIKNEVDDGNQQLKRWVYKIDDKAHQIKDMADCILEYTLKKKTSDPADVREESFRSAFYDALSETCICLTQKGFEVRAALSWEDKKVCIDPKYVNRILDNISSNIIKYASPKSPVRITSFCQDDCCGFLFENEKQKDISQVESTGIGVCNIREMMEEMGGSCQVEDGDEVYRIRVIFTLAKDKSTDRKYVDANVLSP